MDVAVESLSPIRTIGQTAEAVSPMATTEAAIATQLLHLAADMHPNAGQEIQQARVDLVNESVYMQRTNKKDETTIEGLVEVGVVMWEPQSQQILLQGVEVSNIKDAGVGTRSVRGELKSQTGKQ